jgi:hypothetical protein
MRKHIHDLGTGMLFSLPLAAVVMLLMWALVELMTIVRPGAVGTDSTPEPIQVTTTTRSEPEALPDIMDPFTYSPEMLAALDVSTLLELQEQDREEGLRCSGSGV